MQRIRKRLGAGLMGGLFLCVAASAQAQTYYTQSSSFRSVPVSQSVVRTRTIVGGNYSYGSGYSSFGSGYSSFGSGYSSFGSGYSSFGSNSSQSQSWNNRRSAPAVYVENRYLPETTFDEPFDSSQTVVASQPVMSSRVVSSRSFVATQPRVIYQPTVTYRTVESAQPVVYSDEVLDSQPVRVYRSVVSSPRVIREESACQSNRRESNPLEIRRLESEPKVTFSESNGRRVKTYRYEYELDHRPGRVTIELDSNN